MRSDARVLLADVENAAADIERYLDGFDGIAYTGDDRWFRLMKSTVVVPPEGYSEYQGNPACHKPD